MNLVEKITELHTALSNGGVQHAFGGALALAWCTQRARGTIDIDVNLFAERDERDFVLATLPTEITVTDANRAAIASEGQTRLWWEQTPVDVFFNTTQFHRDLAARTRFESFAGHQVPFLACNDLAVFKAFFNRTKDWADLEEMHHAGTLDAAAVIGTLAEYLGGADDRVARLRAMTAPPVA